MFVLTLIRQTVEVPAEKFNLEIDQAVSEVLNQKFANKVLLNVGLCIALWDITKRGESFIMPGRSGHHTKVEFRYVVFRPFIEEILVGKVKSCNKDYVQVSLGFFDDIIIPADSLQKESHFIEKENIWVWKFINDEGEHDLTMDTGEDIRFKVVAEEFNDTTPSTGPIAEAAIGEVAKENKKLAFRLIGTINEPGLGLLSWWSG